MLGQILRKPQNIQTIYIYLLFGNVLATSFIWGIDTIFLLNAGLSNFEAFAVNGFFSLGQVIFEVPTGIVADTLGRRMSYLLGSLTLAFSTLLYIVMWQTEAPFIGWAFSSMLLGLGYTFFSGALEAWLVDALHATNFKGSLDQVFAKGQITGGIAMLTGSILGGIIAQVTNLGIPYLLRAAVLILTFVGAFFLMKDLGFKAKSMKRPIKEIKNVFKQSIDHGLRNAPVRWIMLAAPFTTGVSFYIFYALQPFLLELYGDERAYGVAGLVAALSAGAQIAGGILAHKIRKLFSKRTTAIILGTFATGVILLTVSQINSFIAVLILIFLWGIMFSAIRPIRQAYLNGIIPSKQRATVLSFDSLMGSSGGIVIQPALGKSADVWSYSTSYMIAGFIQWGALPFLILARRRKARSDSLEK